MSDEGKEIINKLREIRQEHERDKYNTHGYILFALAFSMLGLYLSMPNHSGIVFLIFSIVFFVWGWIMRFRARKVSVE